MLYFVTDFVSSVVQNDNFELKSKSYGYMGLKWRKYKLFKAKKSRDPVSLTLQTLCIDMTS